MAQKKRGTSPGPVPKKRVEAFRGKKPNATASQIKSTLKLPHSVEAVQKVMDRLDGKVSAKPRSRRGTAQGESAGLQNQREALQQELAALDETIANLGEELVKQKCSRASVKKALDAGADTFDIAAAIYEHMRSRRR